MPDEQNNEFEDLEMEGAEAEGVTGGTDGSRMKGSMRPDPRGNPIPPAPILPKFSPNPSLGG